MNGFLTVGRKKNGEVEDELDRSLEGMDHSDDQFDKGTDLRHHAATDCELPLFESRFVELFDSYSSEFNVMVVFRHYSSSLRVPKARYLTFLFFKHFQSLKAEKNN